MRPPNLNACITLIASGLVAALSTVLPAAAATPVIQALSEMRRQGCDRIAGRAEGLRSSDALDAAARELSRGAALEEAARRAGYRARRLFQMQLSGFPTAEAAAHAVAQRQCQALMDAELAEAGAFGEGDRWWIVLAQAFRPPSQAAAGAVSQRVLQLVNEARARPRRCGDQAFAAAPPLRYNPALEKAAAAHAQDMARNGFLAHEGRDSSTPADRATRAGYDWRSVGENIASGQTDAQEVVDGWLRSPPHCANIMEAGFSELGVAFAVNPSVSGGIYWAQVFGRSRSAPR